jgi:outer membrane protein assembly factor BamB
MLSGDVFLYDVAAAATTKIPNVPGQWHYGPSVNAEGTMYFGRSNFGCGENAEIISRTLDGTGSVLYTFRTGRDFSFSIAVDNDVDTTDVYFDRGSCRGSDFGDILKLPGV